MSPAFTLSKWGNKLGEQRGTAETAQKQQHEKQFDVKWKEFVFHLSKGKTIDKTEVFENV